MKKLLLTLTLTIAATLSAYSQVGSSGASGLNFGATPSTQNVNAGSSFNVTLTLAGTTPPANITGYDVYLLTDAANTGLFTIQSSTPSAPFNSFGPTGFPDAISTASSNSAFVMNSNDLGYSGPTQTPTAGAYNFTLQTLNISVAANAAPGTYTFYTSTFANSGNFYGDVSDSLGNVYTVGQGTFNITVASTAVPEPSTWFAGIGAAGLIGYTMLRRRQTA